MRKLVIVIVMYLVVLSLPASAATVDAYAPASTPEQVWQAKADEILASWGK